MPEVTASTNGHLTKYMPQYFYTIRSYVYQLLFAYPVVIPRKTVQISQLSGNHTFPRPAPDDCKYLDFRKFRIFDASQSKTENVSESIPSDRDLFSEMNRGPVRSPHFLEPGMRSKLEGRRLDNVFPYPIKNSNASTAPRFRWTPWDHLFWVVLLLAPSSSSTEEIGFPSWTSAFHAFALHLWSQSPHLLVQQKRCIPHPTGTLESV